MYPPAISKLAKKFVCVPASSGAVKQLFSITGNMFRPESCRLTDTVIEIFCLLNAIVIL